MAIHIHIHSKDKKVKDQWNSLESLKKHPYGTGQVMAKKGVSKNEFESWLKKLKLDTSTYNEAMKGFNEAQVSNRHNIRPWT